MEKYNPLEKWRGSRSPCTVAFILHLSQQDYLTLEAHPEKSNINSDQIILIAQELGVPLEVLVDYLESNPASA